MTRLFVLLAGLVLYVAPPVGQAFAASHVRPPGTALVRPTSADTELTPIPEPVGYWARIFDSVANDPQAVATIIAAFLGFLSGVLVKYGLDRRAERLRRQTDRRILATALRAELFRFHAECDGRIGAIEELLKEEPEKEIHGGPHDFTALALPPRRVWMAHLGRIGELKGFGPENLVHVHSMFDIYDLAIQTSKQRAGGQGINREDLQTRMDQLRDIRVTISVARATLKLAEQTKVGPISVGFISRF